MAAPGSNKEVPVKKILLSALAAVFVAATSHSAPLSTSLAKCQATTFCENCDFGGDQLKAPCLELDFLSLALNPKNGRYEGVGTVKVYSGASFVDPSALFSVAMVPFASTEFAALGPYNVGQFIVNVHAEGHIPGTGEAYAVNTVDQKLVNFAPAGSLAIKDVLTLEVVSAGVPGLGRLKQQYRY
jgi:hypothetical protein